MQCWPPRRKFPCSLRERYKILKFFEIFLFQFSSKWSYGHQECSDYNLNQEFLTEGRIFFAQCTKILMKHWIQKIDLHEDPIVSVNAVLTTPPKLSLQSPRMIKNSYFFSKNPFFVFPQYVVMDTKNAVITTSPKRFWRKAEKFSLNVQKR